MGKKRAKEHYDFIREQYHKEIAFMPARALKLGFRDMFAALETKSCVKP